MVVASDEATAGPVIAKGERIRPSRGGTSRRSRRQADPAVGVGDEDDPT
ncbi:hypothetical protein [Micromonospora sp. NPDC051141]